METTVSVSCIMPFRLFSVRTARARKDTTPNYHYLASVIAVAAAAVAPDVTDASGEHYYCNAQN